MYSAPKLHATQVSAYPLPYTPDLLMNFVPVAELGVELSDHNQNTALHLACLQGHEECAMAILDKCSDDLLLHTNASERT